ncbi:MAG: hypothetical protein EA424_25100 [Planctomycetaceae bacterium]|nr:MAG: hypothetical protein EA424_25100 [Planctomycetaceae bacterium]
MEPRQITPIICLLWSVGLVLPAAGQTQAPFREGRLPPMEVMLQDQEPFDTGAPQYLLASDPAEFVLPEDVLASTEPHLSAYKQSFFQKLSFTVTGIVPDGSDGLGILETELFAAFALPAPTTKTPLILTPTFSVDFIDEPAYVALPSELYGLWLDLMWLPKFGPRATGILAIAPGWYSDFQDGWDDSFRLTGRALLRYDWIPDRLQLVLGTVYTNRMANRWIPAAGLIINPNPDLSLDLIFPRAKMARRTAWGLGFEHWIYIAGGFGGNDWTIVQPDDSRDKLGLLDWRISLGWERKMNGGAGFHVEVGYVFSREIRLASEPETFRPDDTLLLRAGIAF